MRMNMKDRVRRMLMLKRQARDNDFYLMYWIWKDEFDKLNLSNNLKIDFDRTNILTILSLLKDRELSHPSGIMRIRRKLQEEHEQLRGEIWHLRHKEQQVVKADLGYPVKQEVAQ